MVKGNRDDSLLQARFSLLRTEMAQFLDPDTYDLLYQAVADVQDAVSVLRTVPLDYSDPPDWPIPVPASSQKIDRLLPGQGPHALPSFSPSDLPFAPVWQLAGWLRNGLTTPQEMTDLFLDRLQRHDPILHTTAALLTQRAHRAAQRAMLELQNGRDRGWLHGISYGAKDLLAVAGAPTTWGAEPLRNQWFSDDAGVIRRLERAGAILLAKLAMVELAGGAGYERPEASWSGPGVNPWNIQHWSGGSSSGTASAVSAGLLPWGIGTETWGSILGPSAFCGLSGLRPSLGRVDGSGAMVLSWTLDKIGPMCRDAWDCGLALEAMTTTVANETQPRPWFFQPHPDRSFRLAVVAHASASALSEIAQHFASSLQLLAKQSSITEVTPPDLPISECTQVILSAEMAAAFERFYLSGLPRTLSAPEDRYRGYANFTVNARDYLQALRVRGKIRRWYQEYLSPFDAVLFPTVPSEPPPLGQHFSKRTESSDGTTSSSSQSKEPSSQPSSRNACIIQALGCLLGLPAMSVPMGFTARGFPSGLTLMGSLGNEQAILDVAIAFQQQTEWHCSHPDWT